MFLESVWSAIPELEWESQETLKQTSGLDEGTLKQTVEFLARWEFVEIRQYPDVQIRRKPGALSPVQTVTLLRSIDEPKSPEPSDGVRIATRIACRVCGCRNLTLTGHNEVECETCHEKQWFSLDRKTNKLSEVGTPTRRSIWKRMFVRLGIPQPALIQHFG